MFDRWYFDILRRKIDRPFVHVLFGARQTGKSTMLNELLPKETLRFDLSNPGERSRLLADPAEFVMACKALPKKPRPSFVFVDEAQSVPAVFDAVQHLFDSDKNRWRFVLCGSSARKMRKAGGNLLPGRSFLHHLHPLTLAEHPPKDIVPAGTSALPLAFVRPPVNTFPPWPLLDRLAFGSLPGVVTAEAADRADLLTAYAVIYLEEEIRREALVRDYGAFVRFLHLSAAESGGILNFAAISREAGVSLPTVKSYYQLLEDMFVGFRVDAWGKSPRKNLLATPKFLFFDTGVRHAAAGLSPSIDLVQANPGPVFEQWVGAELWKRARYLGGKLHYLRTRDGAEIDFIVEHEGELVPIEVKWTARPTLSDARQLDMFIEENPKQARRGFVVCRIPRPLALSDRITAIPWESL